MRKHIYSLIVLFSLAFTACDRDFGDINNDPNKITDISAESLFHNVVGTLGQTAPGENQCFSPMMQYMATTNGNYDVIGNTYTLDGTAMNIFSSVWRSYCVDFLRYINQMEVFLEEEEKTAGKMAQINILRAILSGQYSDTFGPAPYDEAGRALQGISYPVYRSEKEIYLGNGNFKGILELLDDAITTLQTSSDPLFDDDILYGADRDKWIKFGASLLLRKAMQISNVEPEITKKYVTKAVAAGVILTENDIAKVNHQKTVTGQPSYLDNSLASDLIYRVGARGYCYGRSYITAMKEYHPTMIDPRLKHMAAVYDADGTYYDNIEDYEGMKNGCEMDDVPAVLAEMTFDTDFTPGIGTNGFATFKTETILNANSYYIVVGAHEVYFLLTEAVLKGYLPGTTADADQYYREGIRMAMRAIQYMHATIPESEIDNYLATLPALGSNTTLSLRDALDEIITQKWLSMFGNGIQIWNDWRRTHYPSILTDNPIENKLGVTNGKVPGRLPFPQDEITMNSEQYEKEVQMLASRNNNYTNDLWWAKPYHN
ncbi:MAG: SusD/RagB family nutrient-binding outer membrane lipoprotein [Tannerellaceae bacterium]|nr:SusD/RagB family nutrient-binding outer membrane lipoprotein [Tannerellaceae bacterium]